MRSVDVDGLDIDSHDLFFGSLFVNGVDVVPLVDAELNRQFPGRELQKAQTPEGLREAWVAVSWVASRYPFSFGEPGRSRRESPPRQQCTPTATRSLSTTAPDTTLPARWLSG
jgi:hypothetical protein